MLLSSPSRARCVLARLIRSSSFTGYHAIELAPAVATHEFEIGSKVTFDAVVIRCRTILRRGPEALSGSPPPWFGCPARGFRHTAGHGRPEQTGGNITRHPY